MDAQKYAKLPLGELRLGSVVVMYFPSAGKAEVDKWHVGRVEYISPANLYLNEKKGIYVHDFNREAPGKEGFFTIDFDDPRIKNIVNF